MNTVYPAELFALRTQVRMMSAPSKEATRAAEREALNAHEAGCSSAHAINKAWSVLSHIRRAAHNTPRGAA